MAEESDSEEEEVNIARKPAFAFSDSDSGSEADDVEEDGGKDQSPEDDFLKEDILRNTGR